MPNPENLKPFQKGQSGNPGGVPGEKAMKRRGRGLDPKKSEEKLAKLMRRKTGRNTTETNEDAVWDRINELAQKGESWACRMIGERLVAAQSRQARLDANQQQKDGIYLTQADIEWGERAFEELHRNLEGREEEFNDRVEAEVQRRLSHALRLGAVLDRDLKPLQLPSQTPSSALSAAFLPVNDAEPTVGVVQAAMDVCRRWIAAGRDLPTPLDRPPPTPPAKQPKPKPQPSGHERGVTVERDDDDSRPGLGLGNTDGVLPSRGGRAIH